MIRKKRRSIEWLEFELLADLPVIHGVFLRKGGVSQFPFDSLNVDTRVGDHEEAVSENLRRLKKALGVQEILFANQVHGKEIKVVQRQFSLDSVDGFITDRAGLGLGIRHADCQVAIFYDPTKHVLANIHSGWRGNVQNIYKSTVELLKGKFNVKPENLLVCISPSLGPSHSEFIHYKVEFPEHFWAFQFKPFYFDLWAIAQSQLLELGVLSHHIEIAKMCTYSNPDDFFSFRRSRTTGRHVTLAMLK